MSNNRKGISVKILGKDYQINCPEGQQHNLIDAAFLLDQKMAEIRKSGRVIGLDRVAVMAALNIANELLSQKITIQNEREEIAKKLIFLQNKIEKALVK